MAPSGHRKGCFHRARQRSTARTDFTVADRSRRIVVARSPEPSPRSIERNARAAPSLPMIAVIADRSRASEVWAENTLRFLEAEAEAEVGLERVLEAEAEEGRLRVAAAVETSKEVGTDPRISSTPR